MTSVVFRVDSSSQIGSGHVMRCLTLAQALKDKGCEVHFICRTLPGHWNNKIKDRGFAVTPLPQPNHPSNSVTDDPGQWLEVSINQDIHDTKRVLETLSCDWLIVDHYSLDKSWESEMRSASYRIAVIDDLANRGHCCDLLLDVSQVDSDPRVYSDLVPASTLCLLGSRYVMLRPEFAQNRPVTVTRPHQLQNGFIFLGAADPLNLMPQLLEALLNCQELEFKIHAFLSPSHSHYEEVRGAFQHRPGLSLYDHIEDMLGFMQQMDFYVGAMSTITWERFCLGLPGFGIVGAENQREFAQKLAQKDAVTILGDCKDFEGTLVVQALQEALQDKEKLYQQALQGHRLVDGLGVKRLVEHLLRRPVQCRPAITEDSRNVYDWRNHPLIRSRSFQSESFSFEEHELWFSQTLENPDRYLLMGESDGTELGVVRFDCQETVAVVSIFLKPDRLGQGWGLPLLLKATAWLAESNPSIQTLEAGVKEDNERSVALFEKAGYQKEGEIYRRRLV